MSKALENLANKTLFITGASRGIGKEIALKAARDGANIVVAAKTAEPHPKLDGTIYTAAEEIEAAGGKALPLVVDVREEDVQLVLRQIRLVELVDVRVPHVLQHRKLAQHVVGHALALREHARPLDGEGNAPRAALALEAGALRPFADLAKELLLGLMAELLEVAPVDHARLLPILYLE